MNYVEWLRVRNALRGIAIALAVMFFLAAIVRLSVAHLTTVDTIINDVKTQAGTKKTVSTLPDGTVRTTLISPRGERVVIDNHGYEGEKIVVTQPAGPHEHVSSVLFGSLSVQKSTDGKFTTTTVYTNAPTPFFFLIGFAELVALIVATILGAPFARENAGHLEISLTKPIGRVAMAIQTMGADAVGVLASGGMAIVAAIAVQALFQLPHYEFDGLSFYALMMSVGLPLAWYALLAAATASMRRNYGAVLGLSWPVLLVIMSLGSSSLGGSIVGNAVHDIAWTIMRAIPLTYASFGPADTVVTTGSLSVADPSFAPRFAAVCALLAIYGALAVWQWRRVEA